jgi:hypothetical protein
MAYHLVIQAERWPWRRRRRAPARSIVTRHRIVRVALRGGRHSDAEV